MVVATYYRMAVRFNSSTIRTAPSRTIGEYRLGLSLNSMHPRNRASGKPSTVHLIDGERLCDLLKENELGVKTEMIEKVRIQSDWFEGI